jgi:mannose-1-phosphate guanylyltransferase
VNVYHFADQVVAYLKAHDNFGMRIEISREDDALLDTGGGLKKAAWFFLQGSGGSAGTNGEPFFLHNVDVISNIDLDRMVEAHKRGNALATLAVQDRETSRYLLFDEARQLVGRRSSRDERGATEWARPSENAQPLAFAGIHVISSRLLGLLSEQGAFSIISTYLRLAAQGEKILAFRADGAYWRDLGRPEDVVQAAEDLKHGSLNL